MTHKNGFKILFLTGGPFSGIIGMHFDFGQNVGSEKSVQSIRPESGG